MLEVNTLPGYYYTSSTVRGTLKENLDALHALSATTNASGVPRLKSMQLLNEAEKAKSPFNSCSLVFLSPDKGLYAMRTHPVRVKKGLAYLAAASRVFNGSNDEKELAASEKILGRFLDALKSAGGAK